MINIKTCKIQILNKNYEIKCPESEETNLLLAAQKLSEKMVMTKSKFKKLDDYKALLLAALDISHELVICKKDQEHQHLKVTQFITSLESKIYKTVGSEADTIPQTD
jgi:cell division protein ZapA